jgi:hypothetical protein
MGVKSNRILKVLKNWVLRIFVPQGEDVTRERGKMQKCLVSYFWFFIKHYDDQTQEDNITMIK